MKVIVDNKIPYIKESIEQIADEVIFLPGTQFSRESVKEADALIIRTRTHCNRALLEGSSVKFIATATIGYDHIDTEYCREKGIVWTNAPGCNAASVKQYVHSALLLLQQKKGYRLAGLSLGIVGVGNVGKQIKQLGESLGMKIWLNDPPRADKGEQGFVNLQTIMEECDVITFHTPLNKEGIYRTFHLADNAFFNHLKKKPVIINSSRGEVIKTEALIEAIDSGTVSEAIIDVWENEPDIHLSLLRRVFIGTPHIAGYSADGKANATRMSIESVCRFFGIRKKFLISAPAPEQMVIEAETEAQAYLKIYSPERDSAALAAHPEKFEQLRGDYPFRREAEAYKISLK